MQADVFRIPTGPGEIHVERYGHGGAPVILLHGLGTCAFLWRDVAPRLARAGYTAYAMDLLGHGESDRPPDADLGIAAQGEYLDAAMTALRVASAAIVGNDLGGDVALRLAATCPERVDRLVLVNTPAYAELPARDVTAMQLSTARFALSVTHGVLGAAPLLRQLLHGSVADPARMPERLVARYLAPFAGESGASHLLHLAASVRGDDVNDLALQHFRAPALVVRGEEDGWVSRTVAERLAADIPRARLSALRGAGRLLPEEGAEWFCEQLLRFMTEY